MTQHYIIYHHNGLFLKKELQFKREISLNDIAERKHC